MSIRKEQLIALLRDKEFREHFTADQAYELLALQVRQLREKRQWTQAELGVKAGMQQVQVSRAENPDYTGSKISTLSRLARAFDVALIVRFAPFSELADWLSKLSPGSFGPASFDEELSGLEYGAQTRAFLPMISATDDHSNIVDLDEFRRSVTLDESQPSVADPVLPEGRYQYARA